MKTVSIIAFLILAISSSAQTGRKSKTTAPYTAKDGQLIQAGDTIMFGHPSGYHFSEKIYKHVFVFYGEPLIKGSIAGRTAIINHFRLEEFDGVERMVAVIKPIPESLFLGPMVNIDLGLKTGEIIGVRSQYRRFKHYRWIEREALLYYIKLLELDASSFSKEYMYRYDQPTFAKYKNDEFELNSHLEKTTNILTEAIRNLTFNAPYAVGMELTLGEYDFGKNAFLVELPEYLEVIANSDFVGDTKVNIIFPGLKQITHFPMDPTRAKEFIQSRKNKYGSIDRKVICKINFKMMDKLTPRKDHNEVIMFLTGKVDSIEFYGNMNKYSDDLGVIFPGE